jgi:hypothetical protein
MDPSEHLGQFNRRLQSKSHRLARANYKQVLSMLPGGPPPSLWAGRMRAAEAEHGQPLPNGSQELY